MRVYRLITVALDSGRLLCFGRVIMAALRSRCGHYIFALRFLLSVFFFSSPNLSRRRLDVFLTWCGFSANLGCRSETCCRRLAVNTGCKKLPKNRHLGTIAQLWRAVSLQLTYVSTTGKKLVKQQYLFHMSSQYGELRPTSGWDMLASLGTPVGRGFESYSGQCCVTTLGKLFTPMCLCHQAV